MTEQTDIIDGWQVREGPDGGFVVCDDHGIVDGPFRERAKAIAAALKLPKRSKTGRQLHGRPPDPDRAGRTRSVD